MKFVSPFWLWGLLILPLVYLLILFDEKKKLLRFNEFIHSTLWSAMIPQMRPGHRVRKAKLVLLAFGFLFVALARPQYGSHEEVVEVTGLDIMLVLDISHSMNVEDVVPSRLKAAKHLTRTLVQQLDGDRVGVVAFAGSSYVACPLTADLSYLMDSVQILGPRVIQKQGTNIGAGIETALKALERGGQDTPSQGDTNLPSHVIILISDGEDHEGEAIAAATKVKTSGVKLYVLGVGTEKGGPIPLFDDKGNLQTYKKDKKGQPIVSTFSETSLKKVASEGGGRYWSVTSGEHEGEELLRDLKGLDRTDYAERKFLVYEDRFQIPLAIAILLFLLEMSVAARKQKQNGIGALIVLFSLGVLLTVSPAVAEESKGKQSSIATAPLETYLENQKGLEAFKEGNIEEAQKSFGAAQARDPSRPELQFNQGIVQFQQGDIDHAIEAFKSSARSSQNGPNQELYGKSLYNLGNSYAKKGSAKEAIQSYLGAIQAAKEQKNQRLEDESRKNLELLLKQIQKQKEEEKKPNEDSKNNSQKQPNDQSDSKPEDKSGNKSQEDSKDQQSQKDQSQDSKKSDSSKDLEDQKKSQEDSQNKSQEKNRQENQSTDKKADQTQSQEDQQKNQQKNQSQSDQSKEEKGSSESEADKKGAPQQRKSGKQQFQSQKMAPEDADRVMSELTNRDRELQEKLQTQNGTSQNNLKDW